MQRIFQRVVSLISGLAICAAVLLNSQFARAAGGTATMYLSPASGSIVNGSTITVDIYENSNSDNVNAVQANLSYPTNLLSYVSYSSSSAFSIDAQSPSGDTGLLNFGRGTLTPVSGAQIVATVRFRAIQNSGTVSISFAAGSAVARSSDSKSEILSTAGGSYSLTSPPSSTPSAPSSPASSSTTPPSSSSSSKPSSSSSPSPSSSSNSTSQKAALTISSVSVSDLTSSTATISWQTSAPASSEVDYGLNTKYGPSVIDGALTTDHKIVLNPKFLSAGAEYHFIVKSVDASGNKVSSQDATFRTKGVLLTVTVTDQKKQAVKGARVTVAGVSGVTDGNGRVTLSDLPVGTQEISVSFAGKTTKAKVKIEPIANKGLNQTAVIRLNTGNQFTPLWLILAGLGVIAIVIGGNFYIRQRKQRRELQRHFPEIPGDNLSKDLSSPTTIAPTINPATAASGSQQLPKSATNSDGGAKSKQEINSDEG